MEENGNIVKAVTDNQLKLDTDGIKRYIAIREPVFLLDSAIVTPGKCAEGEKNLEKKEAFWEGHYPDYPIMPGTYQLEALAQLFSLTFLTMTEEKKMIPKLVGFDHVRFFKEVFPVGILYMQTELVSLKRGLAKGTGKAYVDDSMVCSVEIKTFIDGLEDM